jgi:S1-C subfamily serine protease
MFQMELNMRTILFLLLATIPVSAQHCTLILEDGKSASGTGSGVCVAESGKRRLIITNKHVLTDVAKVFVLKNGKLTQGTNISLNADTDDLASFEIEADIPVVKLADELPKNDEQISHVGREPANGKVVLYTDITSNRQVMSMMFHSALIVPGDSGSGVFNSNKELVAINSSVDWKNKQTLAVPLPRIRNFLKSRNFR